MRDIDVRPVWWRPDLDAFSVRPSVDAVVLAPAGELDSCRAHELETRLKGLVESTDAPMVLIDLASVNFIDARCVGVIVQAQADARRQNRALYVEGLSGLPARVFDALGLRILLTRPTPGNDCGGRDR